MRVFNFSAGPAAMPEDVLRQAADEMLDWHGSGMSVMEMSHRGREFISIHEAALADLRELLAVPANYRVLFLQGGGIAENAIVPMNLLGTRQNVDFVVTGSWSQKSFKEAQKYGTSHLAATGRTEDGFTRVPAFSEWQLSADPAYVHLCTNETIDGVETFEIPDTGDVPLVADVSSHILSRPIDVSRIRRAVRRRAEEHRHGGRHAGDRARGPARPRAADLPFGVRMEDRGREQLDVQHAAHLRDLHRRAGVQVAEAAGRPGGDRGAQHREGGAALRHDRRQQLLPQQGGEPNARSRMNVPFFLADETRNEDFLAGAKARGLLQLKGHKSVGGMRASIYNAVPLEGVKALVEYMKDFERGQA